MFISLGDCFKRITSAREETSGFTQEVFHFLVGLVSLIYSNSRYASSLFASKSDDQSILFSWASQSV